MRPVVPEAIPRSPPSEHRTPTTPALAAAALAGGWGVQGPNFRGDRLPPPGSSPNPLQTRRTSGPVSGRDREVAVMNRPSVAVRLSVQVPRLGQLGLKSHAEDRAHAAHTAGLAARWSLTQRTVAAAYFARPGSRAPRRGCSKVALARDQISRWWKRRTDEELQGRRSVRERPQRRQQGRRSPRSVIP